MSEQSKKILRREMLMGSAALVSGLFFSSCNLFQQVGSPKEDKKDSHLVAAVDWKGLDFAWLPGSTHLAYASTQGLFIVDRKNGAQVWRQKLWPQHDYQRTQMVTWSSDGTHIAYLAKAALLVQDVQTGENLRVYQPDQVTLHTAALSPDGAYIAVSQSIASSSLADAVVQIMDVQAGKDVTPANVKKLSGVRSLLWSPDGKLIASTSTDGSVQVWQVADGHQLWSSETGRREAISWSPDSSTLAFIAGGAQALLGVCDALTGQVRFQTPANVGYTTTPQERGAKYVAWSPDGTQLAFEAIDRNSAAIEVWSAHNGKRLFTCQRVNGQPTNVTWSPDGKYLAAGNYLVGTGELVRGDNGERSVIQFWDASNGKALFTYSAPKSPDHLTWSPDGHYLAIITPRIYGVKNDSANACTSLCQYGYLDYALEIFQVG